MRGEAEWATGLPIRQASLVAPVMRSMPSMFVLSSCVRAVVLACADRRGSVFKGAFEHVFGLARPTRAFPQCRPLQARTVWWHGSVGLF